MRLLCLWSELIPAQTAQLAFVQNKDLNNTGEDKADEETRLIL